MGMLADYLAKIKQPFIDAENRLSPDQRAAMSAVGGPTLGDYAETGKRVAAGAIASPITLPSAIITAPNDITKLVDAGTAIAADKGMMKEGTQWNAALPDTPFVKPVDEFSDTAQHFVDRQLGLGTATTPQDIAAEVAGQMLLNPSAIVKGLGKVPGALTKTADVVTGTPNSAAGKGAVVTLAGGAAAGADALMNDANADPYASLVELPANSAQTATQAGAAEAAKAVADPYAGLTEVSEPAVTPFTGEAERRKAQDDVDLVGMFTDNWGKFATAAAVTAGGLVAWRAMKAKPALDALYEASSALGHNTPVQYTSDAVKVKAGLLDGNMRVQEIVDKTLGLNDKIAAQTIADEISRVGSPLGAQERAMFVLDTGKLPDSAIEMPAFRTFANSVEAAQRDAPDALARYTRGALAADELEARALGKISPDMGTMDDLKLQVAAMRTDPVALALHDRQKSMMNAMLDWHRERGSISAEKYNELRMTQPSYIPRMQADKATEIKLTDPSSISKRAAEIFSGDPLNDAGGQKLASLFEREGRAVGEKIIDPVTAMEQYIARSVRYVEVNKIRDDVIRAVEETVKVDKDNIYKTLFTKEKAPSDNTVTVRRDGHEMHYRVDDAAIHSAMLFTPKIVLPLMNAQRKIMSTGTTGLLAPLQALTSFMYDAGVAGTMAPKQFKHSFFGAPINDGISGYIHGARGLVYGIAGDMSRAAANALEKSYMADGLLADMVKAVGLDPVDLARRGAEGYTNGVLGMFREAGLSGAGRFDKDAQLLMVQSAMNQLAPAVKNGALKTPAIKMYNAYTALHEAFNSAQRLSFFAMNLKDGMTKPELNALIKATAELTGDFRKRGDSTNKLIAGVREAMPYGNVTLQALGQMAKMSRDQPLRTISGYVMGGMVPALATLTAAYYAGPEAMDHLLFQLSPGQRSSRAPIYMPGEDPTQAVLVPVDPLQRIPYSMMLHVMAPLFSHAANAESGIGDSFVDAIYSYITDLTNDDSAAAQDMKSAVMGNIVPGVPPIVGAVAALSGRSVRLDEPQDMFKPLADSNMTGEKGLTAPLPANATYLERKLYDANIQAMLSAQFGVIAQTTMAGIQELHRGLTNGKPISDSFANAGSVALNEQSRTGMLSPLLGYGTRMSTQNAEGKQLSGTLSAIKENMTMFASNNQGELPTIGNKAQAAFTDVPKGIADPRLVPAYQAMAQTYKVLSTPLGPLASLKKLQSEMESASVRPSLDPEARARVRNEYVQKIQLVQRQVLNQILQAESQVSQRYGVPIEFKKLNRQATLDDFAQ